MTFDPFSGVSRTKNIGCQLTQRVMTSPLRIIGETPHAVNTGDLAPVPFFLLDQWLDAISCQSRYVRSNMAPRSPREGLARPYSLF